MENTVESYSLTDSEGYSEFLTSVGVPWIVRKMILNTRVILEVARNGDTWTLAYKSPIKNTVFEFSLGVEFEQLGSTGKMEKSIASLTESGLSLVTHTERGDEEAS